MPDEVDGRDSASGIELLFLTFVARAKKKSPNESEAVHLFVRVLRGASAITCRRVKLTRITLPKLTNKCKVSADTQTLLPFLFS